MPEVYRYDYPGSFHHVYLRGVDRQAIFLDAADRFRFLESIEKAYKKYKFKVHAYCLMDNHYHLYIESVEGNLSSVMHKINTAYVRYFNIKYDRLGPLFERRFNSKVVQSNNYSLTVMAYIHNNPVKDGLVREVDQYLWSSYPIYIGKFKPRVFFEMTMILDYFRINKMTFNSEFKKFHHAKHIKLPEEEIWGSDEFKNMLYAQFDVEKKKGDLIVDIEGRVCNILGMIEKTQLTYDDKKKLAVFALHEFTPLTLEQIGKRLGGQTANNIGQIYHRFKNKKLNAEYSAIFDNINRTLIYR